MTKINYYFKIGLLILPIFISVSIQSYYFEARQSSYLSNVNAQDFSFTELNVFQERDELYNNYGSISEFRNISFNDEIAAMQKRNAEREARNEARSKLSFEQRMLLEPLTQEQIINNQMKYHGRIGR